jgi:hypothetical protein
MMVVIDEILNIKYTTLLSGGIEPNISFEEDIKYMLLTKQ